jgi:hypothetical protein
MLRWLVDSVPPRLNLDLSSQQLHAGGVTRLQSELLNPDFTPMRGAEPRAIVTAADGSEQVLPLTEHPSRAGVYETDLRTDQAGDYLVRVELDDDEEVLQSGETRLGVSAEGDEYFRSEMNEKLLGRIASETGGRFFGADDADRLGDALDDNQPRARALLRHELWDMPILFLLLVLLLGSEWGYRRWRGLA